MPMRTIIRVLQCLLSLCKIGPVCVRVSVFLTLTKLSTGFAARVASGSSPKLIENISRAHSVTFPT